MKPDIMIMVVMGALVLVAVVLAYMLAHDDKVQRCIDEGGWQAKCNEVHKMDSSFNCTIRMSELELTMSDATWNEQVCVALVGNGWNG